MLIKAKGEVTDCSNCPFDNWERDGDGDDRNYCELVRFLNKEKVLVDGNGCPICECCIEEDNYE